MASLETIPLLVHTTLLALLAGMLFVSLRLHRAHLRQTYYLHGQLDLARESQRSENLLRAVAMLRDQDFRAALMVVRNRLRGRPVENWEAADSFHVLLVCSTYNLVALMIKHRLLDQSLFVEHWGASVVDSYEALHGFIARRQERNPLYCADYAWLYQQCKGAAASEAPSREMPMPTVRSGPRPLRKSG